MNSYENSLNSYIKLFPNSYMPLLLMYLSREGLIDIELNTDADDSRILYRVEKEELKSFLDVSKKWISVLKKYAEVILQSEDKTMREELVEELISDGIDTAVLFTVYNLLLFSSSKKFLSVSIVIDVPNDSPLKKVINVIKGSDLPFYDNNALFFYAYMILTKYSNKKKGGNGDKWDHKFWVEDFEYTFSKIQSCSGYNEFVQPKELTQLVLSLYKGGSIYNPFAGIASYAIQLHYELGAPGMYSSYSIGDHYYADEINELTWAIGKLRLLAYDSDSKNYVCGDSSLWRKGIANNILSTPPIGYRIKNEKGKTEYADDFVIRRGIDMLAENGLLACVVPMTFMSRRETADLRKRIVDEGLLESIVYLPEKLFQNSSIRTAIVFIRKAPHDHVTLINATDAIRGKNRMANILDEEIVANLLYHDTPTGFYTFDSDGMMEEKLPKSKFYRLKAHVSYDEIATANYDLIPGRYFLENITVVEGYKLLSLNTFVNGLPNIAGESGHGKIIRPSMLAKDGFTHVSADNLPEGEFKKDYRVIDRSALLFSPLASLRPTLFDNPNGEKVYYKPDTLHAVYLKKDVVIPDYIVLELDKPYVQEQISLFTVGYIPRLKIEDFLSVYIQIPSSSRALSIEKSVVDQQKALHFSEINAELARLKDKQHDNYVKMLRQRKHRIGQILGDLVPGFDLLDDFRIEKGGVLRDSDIVAFKTGETVEDYFIKLRKIIARVNTLVKNLTDNEEWGAPTLLNIDDFINDIPNNHLSDKFSFQFSIRHYDEKQDARVKDYMVFANKSHLSTVFENIISNASRYGFTDNKRKDYRIRIFMDDDMIDNNPAVRICISNNGTPIHPSVDRSRFFEWGYGSGDGIGTWQLKDIIEHYGGSVRLNEYPDDDAGFCTEYEIIIPRYIENE